MSIMSRALLNSHLGDLLALPEQQFLYLSTIGWRSGRKHKIEIWFVQRGGRYYLMSENRERAHWVQNILHDRAVSFDVDDRSLAGTGQVIRKGPIADDVKKLMRKKYDWDSGLIVELAPENS